MLPPLTFTHDELEALVLGLRWSGVQDDAPLAEAAHEALAKIAAVLPAEARIAMQTSGLLVPGRREGMKRDDRLTLVRRAIRDERKLRLDYTDLKGSPTERTVWPIALGFFEKFRMLVAWCELRNGFRHFRADLIRAAAPLPDPLPRRRAVLLAEWRKQHGIPDPP